MPLSRPPRRRTTIRSRSFTSALNLVARKSAIKKFGQYMSGYNLPKGFDLDAVALTLVSAYSGVTISTVKSRFRSAEARYFAELRNSERRTPSGLIL